MAVRNVRKNLAGMEDLLQGVGTTAQTRNATTYTMGKVDTPYAVQTEAALTALDVTVFTRARLYSDTLSYLDYIYDAADVTGITPDVGAGSWLLAKSSSTNVVHSEDSTTYNLATYLGLLSKNTIEAKTWYVDQALGTDDTVHGTGTGSDAFKTIQFAWDSLPEVILHQQTIQLADGTYDDNYVPGASQPRAAILAGHGKITTFRSTLSGADLTGAIVIKGNPVDFTAVTITTGSEFTYGVYINKGNIAIQDLSIESDNVTQASALLVAHRTDTYIHCLNVIIDGIAVGKAKSGISCESGGQIEFTGAGQIDNCAIGATTQTAGDTITIATNPGATVIDNCSEGVVAKANSFINLNSLVNGAGKVAVIGSSCTTAISIATGAVVTCRGQDASADMLQIASPIIIEGGYLEFVFSETLDTVTVKNGRIRYNASNYKDVIILQDSNLHLETSNSFVSPASASSAVRPIQVLGNSNVFKEGTANVINGSAGLDRETTFPSTLTAVANSDVLAPVKGRLEIIISSATISGPHTACEISSDYSDGSPIGDGEELSVVFNQDNTHNIQLVGTGTHMLFTDAITIGKTSGHYTGATFKMTDSKWHLESLGQLILGVTPDTVNDTAACSLLTDQSNLVTTGAAVPTLADGYEGQLKTIYHKTYSGAATITPANMHGGTSVATSAAGQTVVFKFTDSKWTLIGNPYGLTIA